MAEISFIDNNSYDEKQRALYRRQIDTLNTFLEKGTITKAQYDKSYDCLKENFEKLFPGESLSV